MTEVCTKENPIGKKAKASGFMALVMSIAIPFTAHEEGLRTSAYLDSVGVATICYGETEGVKMGDTKTKDECTALFYTRLGFFYMSVRAMMLTDELHPKTWAALTSWAYNVGLGAVRRSTLRKLVNNNQFEKSCDELLKWKFAGGRPILLKRRERERLLCLEGINELK